jgi:hypothetical protein
MRPAKRMSDRFLGRKSTGTPIDFAGSQQWSRLVTTAEC